MSDADESPFDWVEKVGRTVGWISLFDFSSTWHQLAIHPNGMIIRRCASHCHLFGTLVECLSFLIIHSSTRT